MQAVQWLGDNWEDVSDLAGARFGVIAPEWRDESGATAELWVDARGVYAQLREGDWIVRARDGRLEAVEAERFPLAYGAMA
ncbi:hypothetical protein [Nocardia sp. NPDC049149]|uniref:hypothetical protein n=1 Tax=Nocardia sp. NPDC049149 TaxID=3364315 RepID=UPI0037215DF8